MKFVTKLLLVLLSLILLFLVVIGCITMYFTGMLVDPRGNEFSPEHLKVIRVTGRTITLPHTANTQHRGVYGFTWNEGAAIVGPIISSTGTSVTRQLLQTTAPLTAETKVVWNSSVYLGALRQNLGLPIKDVSVPDSLGPMPAWYVPGRLATWALLVHGYDGSREVGLRVFPTLARLGLPILDITYRNNGGAPASPQGISHLGGTEWQDLQAAAKYALAHGAHHLVLYGWSLGGAIVEAFEHHSAYARYVQALVLDSPVLNWRATLAYIAKKHALPPFFATMIEHNTTWRAGINFADLDQLALPQPDKPILLFHCVDDTLTPVASSDAFARMHARIVTYYRIPDSEHIQAWNTDPMRYEQALRTFLIQKLHLQTSSRTAISRSA